MAEPIVYGPSFSTYARTVRLVLEEKGVTYQLKPVNIMVGEADTAEHRGRHPFGKVPAFEHDGFAIYETGAIARYIDRVFPGPALQPADPKQAARMDQIIAVIDSYAYGAVVGKLVWQRLVVPMQGGQADEAAVEGSLDMVRRSLTEFERLRGSNAFLAGSEISLADCFLAPVFAYLTMTPEAETLLQSVPGLRQWWDAMSKRPSMERTPPQFG
jgi:glutathione S-transferase